MIFNQLQISIEKQKMLTPQKFTSQAQQPLINTKKSVQKIRWRKQKNSGPPIFISKTYQILENGQFKDVISWNEEGTNFIIADVEQFQQVVLPIYFRHRNFSSFVRQLNMYDFHKIRNQQNKNIFQHKQFRRHFKQSLRNIKRKGCNGKKNPQTQEGISAQEQYDAAYEIEDSLPRQLDRYQSAYQSLDRYAQESPMASINIIHRPASPSPQKKKIMDEFMSSLPEIVSSQLQIQQRINELKRDPRYQCLNTKQDIRKIIGNLRRKMPKRQEDDDLQQLSIQEQILADKIDRDRPSTNNPTLAILSTQRFLPAKSISLIGSLNFCEDIDHLFYSKLY